MTVGEVSSRTGALHPQKRICLQPVCNARTPGPGQICGGHCPLPAGTGRGSRKAGMDIPGICRRAARIIVVRRGNHMENIGAMLKQINDRLHAQADATLKENGLTFTQARVLRYLHRAGGQASQKALGDYLEVAHPTIVGIVSRLEREGFVTCSTGVADRRSKVVCLTAKAVAIRDCMDQSIRKTEQRLVAGLSQEEVDQLRGLLTRLHRNLE